MCTSKFLLRFLLLLGLAGALPALRAADDLLITEFMAVNDRTFADEDGDYPDWIEIYNAGTNTVNLAGWSLTDAAGNLTKWLFPATNIPPNGYLLVFASNKDRRVAGSPLHTNFRLSSGGSFLGLIGPATNVVAAYSPVYPAQVAAVSYGIPVQAASTTLVRTGALARVLVPSADPGAAWVNPDFDDASWTALPTGIGYETDAATPTVLADTAADFSGVQGQNHWFYGFYDKSVDIGGVYQSSNFVAFPSGDATWGLDNYFNGSIWDWPTGAPANSELAIGATTANPNGLNSGGEQWAIRRWVSEVAGTVTVDWFLAKSAAGGAGVTAYVFHNNNQRDTALIAGNNVTGTNRSVVLNGVQIGDSIDICLGPVGTGNDTGDVADLSVLTATVKSVVTLSNQISSNIEGSMRNINASALIRIPFVVTNAASYDFLSLRLKYDDGFRAYLNGLELVSRNAPQPAAYNSAATGARPDASALLFEEFNVSPALLALVEGTNVLAIHGLNASAEDADFLILPELIASRATLETASQRYFAVPTPGAVNGVGNTNLGPIIVEVEHEPPQPTDDEDLYVTARVRQSFQAVASVALRYKVMFATAETEIPMLDDGLHLDGAPGDGVYGAVIPASAAGPGQMVRWYVRAADVRGNTNRLPSYLFTASTPQYFGTVVHDPSVSTKLPVLQLFITPTDLANAGNAQGTRYPAALFYLGEFYDNIGINRHGQSSQGFPKRSYDIDFNRGYNFKYQEGADRVDDVNLLTTYPDKAKVRNVLAYGTYRDAGASHHFVVPVRVQTNGGFFGDWHMVENGDENYLKRLGKDANGAFYKMYNQFNSPGATAIQADSQAEKKTRRNEGNGDLVALYSGVTRAAGAPRANYTYDNLNVPAVVNFLAAKVITADIDCCHKNYYFYRDTEGTGQWEAMPWDVDLSFGRNWRASCSCYWDDTMYAENGLGTGGGNFFFDTIFSTPSARQMYYRRIRTLMDELLQPTNTPPVERKYEKTINELVERGFPDAEQDLRKWGTWKTDLIGPIATNDPVYQNMRQASDLIITNYLPRRRAGFFNRTLGGATEIPAAPQATNVFIRVDAVEANPAGGNQAEEYIQLRNTNNVAVDVSGWTLGGAVDFTFQGGTVIPAGSNLWVSPNLNAFRTRATGPRGGQGLFVVGSYSGQLSARGESVILTDKSGRGVHTNTYPGNPSGPQRSLRITEIMYHPAPALGSGFATEDYEFIELRNLGATPLDLTGVHFDVGIEFTFGAGGMSQLAAGQRLVLVRNAAAFTARHGNAATIAGTYTGSLENNGERIRLRDASNEEILDFDYENDWYPATDGAGFSLVIVDENAAPEMWDSKLNWNASGVDRGSPGAGDVAPAGTFPIVISEVLTHTDLPQVDYVELHNTGATDVNVGGWFLSDDFTQGRKYRIAANTLVPAGGYLVLNESQFNPTPGVPPSFAFSSAGGDEVYLFSGDGVALTGFHTGYRLEPAENGVPFGRYTTSTGAVHFVALAARSSGAANGLPKVGPLVISEIQYHPPDLAGGRDDRWMEFIEIANTTGAEVALHDGTNPWRIHGEVDYNFPAGAKVPGSGFALVVNFHPLDVLRATAFRTRYNLAPTVPLYGPYSGSLANGSGVVRLSKPEVGGGPAAPYYLADQVHYSDSAPWPAIADGAGLSLQRLRLNDYGDDIINWTAVVPTPSGPYPGGNLPVITQQPVDASGVASLSATLSVRASGTPPLAYQWLFEGQIVPGASSSNLVLSPLRADQAGKYSVIVYNGAGFILSTEATVTVLIPASITLQPVAAAGRPGTNLTFTVAAVSSSPIRYQWRFNGVNIPGATNTSLTISNVQLANGGIYSAAITDSVGTIFSAPARLSVLIDPLIVQQPISQSAVRGGNASFSVMITNTATLPITFRWRRSGATVFSNSLNSFVSVFTTNNVTTNGNYDVIVLNAARPSGLQSAVAALSIIADTDGDGIPDELDLNPNDAGDRDLDGDGDGATNYEEYVAGTNPADRASVLRVTQETPLSPATVTFPAVSNRTYTVQFTDGLTIPASSIVWQRLADVTARSNSAPVSVSDPAPGATRIYRIVTPGMTSR